MGQIEKISKRLEEILLMSTEKSYLLRTRIERELVNINELPCEGSCIEIKKISKELLQKIKFVSDSSTQDSAGISNLFYVVKDDLCDIVKLLKN